MNTFTPCAEWEAQLAARHPEDLSSAEHMAMNKHIASCLACAETYADYELLTTGIRALPQPILQPLPHFLFAFQKQEEQMTQHENIVAIPLPRKVGKVPVPLYSRFAHSLNIAVAMLAVAVIIVSAFLLFTPHQGTVVSGTGKIIPLPQSKVVGGYTVTLERAYADPNLALVGFTIQDSQHHSVDEQHVWLVPQQLITKQGLRLRPDGSANGFAGNEFLNMQSLAFDTGAVPANTRVLDLHFDIVLVRTYIPGLTPPANGTVSLPQIGQTSFDFSVPFDTGRAIDMHQTVTVHGVSLTLERVVVSRSEIRIFLFCPNASLAIVQNDYNRFSLSDGNQHSLMQKISDLRGPIIVLQFQSPPVSEYGEWTLQFKVTTPQQHAGTLTFQFVVPA